MLAEKAPFSGIAKCSEAEEKPLSSFADKAMVIHVGRGSSAFSVFSVETIAVTVIGRAFEAKQPLSDGQRCTLQP